MDEQRLSQFQGISFPLLTFLSFRIHAPNDPANFLSLIHAPNLRAVRVHHNRNSRQEEGCDLRGSLHALRVFTPGPGHPNIRSLTLYACTCPSSVVPARAFFEILSELPSLTHLALEKVSFDTQEFLALQKAQIDEDSGITTKILPLLESIELGYPSTDFDLEAFLEYVDLRSSISPHGSPDTLKEVVFRFSRNTFSFYGKKDSLFLRQFDESQTLRRGKTLHGVVVDVCVHKFEMPLVD
ncbi:hypothetical protein NMY22_g1626 [Coprinellus aureogranulatus]|nr:hypothetical protein NMY22_g1626 [Coprinellus aureogranulatus]